MTGAFTPIWDGSPYNVARALARQGAEVTWLTPFSTDQFGDRLRHGLVTEGVQVPSQRSSRPS
ncbi:MAG: PfkB family carbohydrate kinase, partial [Myxococcota bacterium]